MSLNINFDWLSAKNPPMLGLDISTTAVKLVELDELGKGRYKIERYAIEPLPRDAVTDGNIANIDQVAEAVRNAWTRLGTRVKHVALALPSAVVITKKVVAPATLKGIDLERQIETEANQAIPFPLDEVNLDFQVLGPVNVSPDDVEVLLAAARKEKVEDRVAVAEAAGLKALVMDVESYAALAAYELLAHLLPGQNDGQLVAIVDIGAQNMHVSVVRDREIVYLREHGFAGNQLNSEIARRYGMTTEEAETAKRRGNLPETYESEVLQPFGESLALEIGRALQMFTTSTQYNRVDQVLLVGGGAGIPNLDSTVSQRVGVPTMIGNPFANMAVGAKVRPQQLANDAPALFVACGLAMRRFDPQ